MSGIFFDNCSTTPLCEPAKKVILDNLDEFWNPNSMYEPSRKMRVKVEEAREKIAELIDANSADEIIFTSGGSEANSLALNNKDIISSEIEHSSIKSGYCYHVNKNGIVDTSNLTYYYDDVGFAEYDHDFMNLITVQYVNNELGTIQPIKKIAQFAHENHEEFHSDMVQAAPHMRINVQDLDVDMASFSAHKFNGPKGVGFLYVKDGVNIHPIIHGTQENGLRGSTENTLGILATAAALEDTVKNLDAINQKTAFLAAKLKETILNIPGVFNNVYGLKTGLVEGLINIRIDGVNGSDLVAACSEYGIYISTGSACHEGNLMPSNVLKSIGLTDQQALSSVRISIGRYNTEEEVNRFCSLFPQIIKVLREQY